MENKTTFTRIEKALARAHAQDLKRHEIYIRRGYWPTWAPEHKVQGDNGLKEYSTPGNWKKYKAGKLDRKTAVEKALIRCKKQLDADQARQLDKLHMAAAAPDLYRIDIRVDWVRNRTWGNNPWASVTVFTADSAETFTGSASGCGYDKETTAIANALNQSFPVLKMLCSAKEKARGRIGIESNDGNKKYIAYGAGYGVLPYFEGGTGMNSFINVFKACGYALAHQAHGERWDCYSFEKSTMEGRK